jgi:hypothetical protein
MIFHKMAYDKKILNWKKPSVANNASICPNGFDNRTLGRFCMANMHKHRSNKCLFSEGDNGISFMNVSRQLYRALDNFSTEEYVTASVLGQGVFDSPSLTLVIGSNIF